LPVSPLCAEGKTSAPGSARANTCAAPCSPKPTPGAWPGARARFSQSLMPVNPCFDPWIQPIPAAGCLDLRHRGL